MADDTLTVTLLLASALVITLGCTFAVPVTVNTPLEMLQLVPGEVVWPEVEMVN